MNSQDFRNSILKRKPRYAKSRIPVFEAFANKGKSKSEYSQFGPYYELYIYAFTIGVKKGLNLPLPDAKLTNDFVEIAKWKGGGSLVDFILMIVFTYSDDIGFNWNDLEDMDEKDLNVAITSIIIFIESHANGGLQYIQQAFDDDLLSVSPYLFVEFLEENSVFKEEEDSDVLSIELQDPTDVLIKDTLNLIHKGESSKVEFKSTLFVNMHTLKRDAAMEHSCIKTIAAFMNTNGGSLLIGVSDKKEIIGLGNDLDLFKNKNDLLDEFKKALDLLLESQLGNSVFSLITIMFLEIEKKKICRLDIQFKKSGPVFSKNKEKKNIEEFYIRRSASTKALKVSEMNDYTENLWG